MAIAERAPGAARANRPLEQQREARAVHALDAREVHLRPGEGAESRVARAEQRGNRPEREVAREREAPAALVPQ